MSTTTTTDTIITKHTATRDIIRTTDTTDTGRKISTVSISTPCPSTLLQRQLSSNIDDFEDADDGDAVDDSVHEDGDVDKDDGI